VINCVFDQSKWHIFVSHLGGDINEIAAVEHEPNFLTVHFLGFFPHSSVKTKAPIKSDSL
jgi:hypothetical protein